MSLSSSEKQKEGCSFAFIFEVCICLRHIDTWDMRHKFNGDQ